MPKGTSRGNAACALRLMCNNPAIASTLPGTGTGNQLEQKMENSMSDCNLNLPVKGVVTIDQLVGGNDEDTKLLREMASGAEGYLRCFPS